MSLQKSLEPLVKSDRENAFAEDAWLATEVEKPCELSFAEFLTCARHLQEAEFERCRAEFIKYDEDSSGTISSRELRNALEGLRHHPCDAVLEEVLNEVTCACPADECQLDLEDFFTFLLVFLDREGFTQEEMRELEEAFASADTDSSGEISVLELSDALPELGCGVLDLDRVHVLMAQIDVNASGTLDIREFVRFMRLRRETEYESARQAFDKTKDPLSGMLFPSGFKDALTAIGYDAPLRVPDSVNAGVGFSTFLELADEVRLQHTAQLRKHAGFSKVEVAELKGLFQQYDQDRTGQIDGKRLEPLLQHIGMAPTTRAEQRLVIERLKVAREKAMAAGVDEAELCQRPGSITFPELLQLLRMRTEEQDREQEAHVLHAAQESHFSLNEVQQFREAFVRWRTRESIFVPPEDALVDGEGRLPAKQRQQTLSGFAADDVRGLLHSLGAKLTESQRGRLDKKIDSLKGSGHVELDFAGFLRLARWLIDSNFADINSLAAALSGAQPPPTWPGGPSRSMLDDEETFSIRICSEQSVAPPPSSPPPGLPDSTCTSFGSEDKHRSDDGILERAFRIYAKSPKGMDSRSFVKACRDCNVVDGQITAVDVELLFASVMKKSYMPAGHRFLDQSQFELALRCAAERWGKDFCDVLVALSNQPALKRGEVLPSLPSSPASQAGVGATASRRLSSRFCGAISSWIETVHTDREEPSDVPSTLAGSPSQALLRSRSLSRVAQPPVRRGLPETPSAGHRRLEDIHRSYSSSEAGMEAEGFEKLCRESLLINRKFSAADAASVFQRAAEGGKHLGPKGLEVALSLVAERKRVSEELLRRTVGLCSEPSSQLSHQVRANPKGFRASRRRATVE